MTMADTEPEPKRLLHEYPVIVVVWGMDGCPMCKEYIPRFRRAAAAHAGCVPAAVFDTAEIDDHWIRMYGVVHVPCTMVLRYGRITARRDQAIEDRTIGHLFYLASVGQECEA